MEQSTKNVMEAIETLRPMLSRRLKFYLDLDEMLAQIKVCVELDCPKPEHLQDLAERFLSIAERALGTPL